MPSVYAALLQRLHHVSFNRMNAVRLEAASRREASRLGRGSTAWLSGGSGGAGTSAPCMGASLVIVEQLRTLPTQLHLLEAVPLTQRKSPLAMLALGSPWAPSRRPSAAWTPRDRAQRAVAAGASEPSRQASAQPPPAPAVPQIGWLWDRKSAQTRKRLQEQQIRPKK